MYRSILSKAIFSLFSFILLSYSCSAQTAEQIAEAKAKLGTMTPGQIEAKVSQYGMTMDQAQAKAAQYGIDLQSYLNKLPAPGGSAATTSLPTVDTTQHVVPQSVVQIVQNPTPTALDTTAPHPEVKPSSLIGPGGLRYFGYDVFLNAPAAFEPTAGPVDPEYLIGPEDVIRINLWGQVEQRNDLEVDNEGRIFIPTVGPVLIAGQTLEQAQKSIIREMSESYKGLVSSPRTVWLDVTIARLRPKQIFIMGEVHSPGGYSVSTYANVFNSLFWVGGPTVKGSLRDVRLIRNNRVIAHIDLYKYFTGAEKINDVRVQSDDIIFVPPRGKTVSVSGEIRLPGIYELLPDENLRKVLDFAGGILPTTYLERVQIEHIIPFEDRVRGDYERTLSDVNFRKVVNDKGDYTLADGDAVTLFPIDEDKENYVMIEGAVFRPGTYQLEKAPTIRDLVIQADSLLPETYLKRADITRVHLDSTVEVLHVDLGKAMAGDPNNNIELEEYDSVMVYSIWDISSHRTVSIRGHVHNPGTYPYADSLTLYDFIFRAGGLEDSIYRDQTYLTRADLIRLNPDGLTKRTIPFNLGALLNGVPGVNMLLQPDDEVVIYEIEVAKVRNDTIQVLGSVRRPGKLHLTTNMTLKDAILLAGGYTEDAWRLDAEIDRVEPTGMGEDSLVYIRFAGLPDLDDSTKGGKLQTDAERANNFHLERYDIVFVRPNPEFKFQELVTIDGEVRYGGQYALKSPNERLSDIIERAGGVKKSAFLLGGTMMRDSQRVNVDFERALRKPGGDYDIVLHKGDLISIPKTPNSVKVSGEVNNPGIVSYIKGDNMWDYIERAGGVTDSANYALVRFPNGNVERHGLGWLFYGNPTLDDGSSIIVTKVPPPPPPPQFPGPDLGTTIKDIFAIAMSAATVIYLAHQIK
ncbi:MAG: SLBB domain-containing protein [Bacteroidota bacterium]